MKGEGPLLRWSARGCLGFLVFVFLTGDCLFDSLLLVCNCFLIQAFLSEADSALDYDLKFMWDEQLAVIDFGGGKKQELSALFPPHKLDYTAKEYALVAQGSASSSSSPTPSAMAIEDKGIKQDELDVSAEDQAAIMKVLAGFKKQKDGSSPGGVMDLAAELAKVMNMDSAGAEEEDEPEECEVVEISGLAQQIVPCKASEPTPVETAPCALSPQCDKSKNPEPAFATPPAKRRRCVDQLG